MPVARGLTLVTATMVSLSWLQAVSPVSAASEDRCSTTTSSSTSAVPTTTRPIGSELDQENESEVAHDRFVRVDNPRDRRRENEHVGALADDRHDGHTEEECGPPPALSESPSPILLPVAGASVLVIGAGVAGWRRSRRRPTRRR
jgi:hypothetical protein